MNDKMLANLDQLFGPYDELGVVTAIGQGMTVDKLAHNCTSKLWLYNVQDWRYELDGNIVLIGRQHEWQNQGTMKGDGPNSETIVKTNFDFTYTKNLNVRNEMHRLEYKFTAIKEMIILFCKKRNIKYNCLDNTNLKIIEEI